MVAGPVAVIRASAPAAVVTVRRAVRHMVHQVRAAVVVERGAIVDSVHAELLVPWWSLTKTVLAAAALTLVRDRQLALDAPSGTLPATLRQLLRHEAGVADYGNLPAYQAAVAAHETPWSIEELLSRAQAKRLRFPPGTGWAYSNIGYLFVRQELERVTGMTMAQIVQTRVCAPLGITEVRFAAVAADLPAPPIVAAGYDPGWVYHGLLVGPLDRAALLLDRLLTGPLLPPPLRQAMREARWLGGPVPGRPWQVPGYGLGLMVGRLAGGRELVGHTGVGPESVVAVYHASDVERTVGVVDEGTDQGAVEEEVVRRL